MENAADRWPSDVGHNSSPEGRKSIPVGGSAWFIRGVCMKTALKIALACLICLGVVVAVVYLVKGIVA